MTRPTKIVLIIFATLAGALAGYFGVQKILHRRAVPAVLGEWRSRQLAGLTLEGPGEFNSQVVHFGPAEEFVESSEMQVFKATGFEIDVLRTVYKSGIELNFDGAAQGAVDGLARLDGIRNLQQSATDLSISGKPARRLSVTAGRWRKNLRMELLLIADGQTYFQVQAIFDAANPHGVADAERLLQSVRLAE